MVDNNFEVQSPYLNIQIDLDNTYKGTWHTHLHSQQPNPKQAVEICLDNGYSFLGVNDHDNRYIDLPWTDADWDKAKRNDFLIIFGFEASHTTGHICCLGALPKEAGVNIEQAYKNRFEDANFEAGYGQFLQKASQKDAFLSLNHPKNWRGKIDELIKTKDFELIDGMEIYNGNQLKNQKEKGYVIDIYDELLTRGYKLWSVACPDCHDWYQGRTDDSYNGHSVVFADSLSRESILSSLKEGKFYTTNGLELEGLDVTDSYIKVELPEKQKITFVGKGGKILSEKVANASCYQFKGDEGYIRTEIKSNKSIKFLEEFPLMVWLQPVWITKSVE